MNEEKRLLPSFSFLPRFHHQAKASKNERERGRGGPRRRIHTLTHSLEVVVRKHSRKQARYNELRAAEAEEERGGRGTWTHITYTFFALSLSFPPSSFLPSPPPPAFSLFER